MRDLFLGFWEFIKVSSLILIIVELSALFEEVISARFELRRGLAGAKTTPFRVFARHGLKVLRLEGGFGKHLAAGAKFLLIFLGAGLLPIWNGKIPLVAPHSLWFFLALMMASPIVQLILRWAFFEGGGWPIVLAAGERTIGSATVHLVLAISLVAMTGVDSFSDLTSLQHKFGWLVLRYPWALVILFSYAVVNLFTSFLFIFQKQDNECPSEWSFDELLPFLRRTVWTLFLVDVFLGGAGTVGLVGNVLLIMKCLIINIISSAGAQLFFKLREDQAEAFILWSLAPLSIVILALSLLFPGGVLQ